MQPVAPIGWPSATAPPLALTFAGSRPRSLVTAIACTAKASFDSITSMSAGLSPALFGPPPTPPAAGPGTRPRRQGKGRVRLDHVHVGGLEPRLLEPALHRRDRTEAHHLR